MNYNKFSKDLNSYVSFALRTELTVTSAKSSEIRLDDAALLSDREGASIEIQSDKLSERELASIEQLMDKYSMLKKYLPSQSSLDQLEVLSSEQIQGKNAQPEIASKAVAVNPKQLEIAKYVAKRVEEIYDFYSKGDHGQAKALYFTLQDFLSKKRSEFIGAFTLISELEESVGMYAVGTNGNPQAIGPAVVFVIIEIYVNG